MSNGQKVTHHGAAWERYMEAERQELENRRNGHLRKLLGDPVVGETLEELEQLGAEDKARAEEGLVECESPDGEVYHKHIEDLSPKDRTDRIAAEGARTTWITQRSRTKAQSRMHGSRKQLEERSDRVLMKANEVPSLTSLSPSCGVFEAAK